jgi:hypothetical protein
MSYNQVVARGPTSKTISFTRNPAHGTAPAVAAPAPATDPLPAAIARPALGLKLVPAQANGTGAKIASVTDGGLAASAG